MIALVLVARINSVDLQVLTIYKLGIDLNRRAGPLTDLSVVYSGPCLAWQCSVLGSRLKNLISWSPEIIYNSQVSHLPPWPLHHPCVPWVRHYRHEAWHHPGSLSAIRTRHILPRQPPVAATWCTDWGPPDVFSCNETHNEKLLTSLLSVPWWRASCPRHQNTQCASFAGVSVLMRNQFCSNVSIMKWHVYGEMTRLGHSFIMKTVQVIQWRVLKASWLTGCTYLHKIGCNCVSPGQWD